MWVQARSRAGRWKLGSESWTTLCFSCSSTVALRTLRLCSNVETAISEVHKLLGDHHLNIVVLTVANGLLGLCGSERADELFTFCPSPPPPPPPPPFPVPNKPPRFCGLKQHVYLLTLRGGRGFSTILCTTSRSCEKTNTDDSTGKTTYNRKKSYIALNVFCFQQTFGCYGPLHQPYSGLVKGGGAQPPILC